MTPDPLSLPTTECTCETCRKACLNRPGWFLPSQVEDLERHFGAPLRELVGTRLAVDWWATEDDDGEILVLSPRLSGREGVYMPTDPRGRCEFFVNDRCTIHGVKPYECRIDLHDTTRARDVHRAVAKAWKDDPRLAPLVEGLEHGGDYIPHGGLCGILEMRP